MAGNQPFHGSDLDPALDKSGQTGATPREYNAHQRHSNLARRRHGAQLAAFLAQQATRLTLTTAQVFAKVAKYGAARVKAAASSASIP